MVCRKDTLRGVYSTKKHKILQHTDFIAFSPDERVYVFELQGAQLHFHDQHQHLSERQG